jgi:hypothetical protein
MSQFISNAEVSKLIAEGRGDTKFDLMARDLREARKVVSQFLNNIDAADLEELFPPALIENAKEITK